MIKSVSTGRLGRVGGEDDVVEGGVTSEEVVCDVTAAWESWMTSRKRILQEAVGSEAVDEGRL